MSESFVSTCLTLAEVREQLAKQAAKTMELEEKLEVAKPLIVLGALVKKHVSPGPYDLTDSPNSLVKILQETVKEVEQLPFASNPPTMEEKMAYESLLSTVINSYRRELDELRKQMLPASTISVDDLDRQCKELIAQGKKIEAVKFYRATMGCGLKEAHDHFN
jgi:hypothetical protein